MSIRVAAVSPPYVVRWVCKDCTACRGPGRGAVLGRNGSGYVLFTRVRGIEVIGLWLYPILENSRVLA
jgi:hypothetical protein